MRTMDTSLVDLYETGRIRYEDALRFISNPKLLRRPDEGPAATPARPAAEARPSKPEAPAEPASRKSFWRRS